MNKRALLAALLLLALSGMMLHYRIHRFMVPDRTIPSVYVMDSTKFLAFLLPLIDVIVVTGLFLSRRTVVYGYLLNGLLVIYGTVLMGHYSIAEIMARAIPPADWLIKSTVPDIGISWADFLVGKILYDETMRNAPH
ncbi:MAG: hypothetical protein C0402_03265 [Thermodesulfovibrio sp.]|nr:hypothetical protein [Thermodesulfovibrio sp.]